MRTFIRRIQQSSVIRISLILFLCFGIVWLIIRALTLLFELGTYAPSEIESFITSLGYIVQSLFYVVAGIVAVLSYLQAKETIFAPIKTEIFKLQIEAFQKILDFFQYKSETDFVTKFDLHQIVRLNSAEMIDEYIKTFFKDSIKEDEEQKKRRRGLIVGANFLPDTLVRVADSISDDMEEEQDEQPTVPALILAKWQQYRHEGVFFTEKFNVSKERLRHLIASPMLPSELKKLLEEFDDVVDENLNLVRTTLVEVSQELPTSCKTPKDVTNYNADYIWNKFIRSHLSFEERAKEILLYINKYLRINQLMT